MLTFICYPKCTTCQKAQKWLDEHNIPYTLRDIKTDNPTLDELAAWHTKSRLPLKTFFNTSGLLYKSMELKSKLPTMSEADMFSLLATDVRFLSAMTLYWSASRKRHGQRHCTKTKIL